MEGDPFIGARSDRGRAGRRVLGPIVGSVLQGSLVAPLLVPGLSGCHAGSVLLMAPGPPPEWTSSIEVPRRPPVSARVPWPGRAGFDTIRREELAAMVEELCHPWLEGRMSPSPGLDHAAQRIARSFTEAGLEPWTTSVRSEDEPWRAFLQPYPVGAPVPDREACRLEPVAGGEPLELGVDFVPIARATGEARGGLVFCGYGIATKGFDELRDRALEGKVCVVLDGEPENVEALDGLERSAAANLYRKLEALERRGAAGALLVRRPPPEHVRPPPGWDRGGRAPTRPWFRTGWASWVGQRPDLPRASSLPALELSIERAEEWLGVDLDAWVERQGAQQEPLAIETATREVRFVSAVVESGQIELANVVGVVQGSDPELRGEYVVVGAHMDHLGADVRGRIGTGADDNASGTAAVVELAEALATSPPARSVIVCTFSGEEAGLLGSEALVLALEPLRDALVAMVNLDMIGRGDPSLCAVLGLEQNPGLGDVVRRGLRLHPTGISEVTRRDTDGLFRRSDHFPFHGVGVPTLFLFEQTPIASNEDYHTWRDVPEALDLDKIARVTRLAFNLVWLLASDEQRPDPPRG